MRSKKIMWQLFLSYLMVIGLPLIVITWYASSSFDEFYMKGTVEDLKSRAYLIGSQVEEYMTRSSTDGIDSLCKLLSHQVNTRFTVISPSGKVLGDSEKKPDSMENHANRSEVIAAFSGKVGVSKRYSFTMKSEMIYTAVPVHVSGRIAAVVRTALPKKIIDDAIYRLYARVALAVIITAILAALTSYLVSRKLSLLIKDMRNGAQRFAAGDFSGKLLLSGYEETDQLAAALNEMASNLGDMITQITSQRNKLDAILSSMNEGVVAIDSGERIIIVNRAAAFLFGIEEKNATGKWIGEVLRNSGIHDFLLKVLHTDKPEESEIMLLSATGERNGNREIYLQLHGSALKNASLDSVGAIMVVNDITQIKKTDMIRKDFVANVSHELRTPLTSIKGFVETLLSGAMNNPEEAKRFLGILSNQADRLNTIVEDLLVLSKIEFDVGKNAMDFTEGSVNHVLDSAIEACILNATRKNITIERCYENPIIARMEPNLLEQAVVNLVDNAINYSENGRHIWINAVISEDGKETIISVKDEGFGIAREHLDRLFERFYRVDKARSRKLGGTGLGLSIVKHIALAHGGRVEVESAPGKGSVFFIYLPRV